jgi:hypothetical protein
MSKWYAAHGVVAEQGYTGVHTPSSKRHYGGISPAVSDTSIHLSLPQQHPLRATRGRLAQEVKGSMAGEYLRKIQSGAHMGPRERFKMHKLMEEEEQRLEAKDDTVGLDSLELKQLKQLKAERMQRKEQQKSKKAQSDYVKLMAEM